MHICFTFLKVIKKNEAGNLEYCFLKEFNNLYNLVSIVVTVEPGMFWWDEHLLGMPTELVKETALKADISETEKETQE
jgi:hypothetical protein